VVYKGLAIDGGYQVDLLVERTVMVELKAVSDLTAIQDTQLLSYLKLSDRIVHVGLFQGGSASWRELGSLGKLDRFS
jgi:GxxExxY protein